LKVNQLILNVTSDQPAVLTQFYRDVVALPRVPDMGESAFDVNGAVFVIDGHSEVHGATKEPARVLINFMVDDLAAEQARLEGLGPVRKQARRGLAVGGGGASSSTRRGRTRAGG